MTDNARDSVPLVIGVGNRYRRDDGVGLVVAQRLRTVAGRAVAVAETSGEGASLLEMFDGSPWVVLVDAVASGAAPGTILRIDAVAERLSKELFRYSSHAFGVADTVELARSLGRLPDRLVIFGVEGGEYGAGEGLSPAVEGAVDRVVELVLAEARTDDTPVSGE